MPEPYGITAEALAARGRTDIPNELRSATHLIYSSPATLSFNAPGAQGVGVKRAGLAIPGSVMLLVSPVCCGRNTGGVEYDERCFYLSLDDTDIVTGRHLSALTDAVQEVCQRCHPTPTVVMICITCVDALLGTDMERVCRKAEAAVGIPVRPCSMYALTREGRLPPMVAVRQTVYSLLTPMKRRRDAVNILGFFSPLQDGCELYRLLSKNGVRQIREISRCRTFQEYQEMAQANFNLVLNQEARLAAQDMERNLGIPSVELVRMYQLDKIHNQYRLLGQVTGMDMEDQEDCQAAEEAIERFRSHHPEARFSVGEWANADPFELSLALLRYGFVVPEIFGTVGDANFPYLAKIARLSPGTHIYSNLSPSMLYYDPSRTPVDVVIGKDAAYSHPGVPAVPWNEEPQPFGYTGVKALFDALERSMA